MPHPPQHQNTFAISDISPNSINNSPIQQFNNYLFSPSYPCRIHLSTPPTTAVTPTTIPTPIPAHRTCLSASPLVHPISINVHLISVPPSTIPTGIKLPKKIIPWLAPEISANSRPTDPRLENRRHIKLNRRPKPLKIGPPNARILCASGETSLSK